MATLEEQRQAARAAAQKEYEEDAERLQQNIQSSMERAASAAAEGNTQREQTWLASANRYRGLLAIEKRLLESALRLIDIKFKDKGENNNNNSGNNNNNSGNNPGNNSGGVNPKPPTPSSESNSQAKPPTKTAPIDTILFNNDEMPIELMFDLIFEDIGGQELINIARNDTINGQDIIYQPIKNLPQIQRQYNPNNILSLQGTMDKYFENFSIIFEDKIPDIGNGLDGSFIYIDPNTGDLVVEVINIQEDEQVQVEIVTSGTILYEENL